MGATVKSLLILFTMQSYKSYDTVSPQKVFTNPFHHAKLQILRYYYYYLNKGHPSKSQIKKKSTQSGAIKEK